MHALEAISKGICPQCFGQRVMWNAMQAESHWCTCCGGTGEYPPPANSGGDGLYDVNEAVSTLVPQQGRRRQSRYAPHKDSADEALAKAKKKSAEIADKPNTNDGDWTAIRNALGHIGPHA